MNLLLRRVFCWKFAFYELFLPLLRTLGPSRCDAVLRRLGQTLTLVWPGRQSAAAECLDQGPRRSRSGRADRGPLAGPGGQHGQVPGPRLHRSTAVRMRASSSVLKSRGTNISSERARPVRASILVGSHLGAYIAGLHWLFRKRLPVRALVQRPRHVSRKLARWFDDSPRALMPSPRSVLAPQTCRRRTRSIS